MEKNVRPTRISASLVLASLLLVSMLFVGYLPTVHASTDPPAWYLTVRGVLDSDRYSLYPYRPSVGPSEPGLNLTIGFSQFGEMINTITNIGLQYDSVDPFAAPSGSAPSSLIPKQLWLQGWLINITYNHVTLGRRNVWAMALHSDTNTFGGPWLRVDFGYAGFADCGDVTPPAAGDMPGIKDNCEDPADRGYDQFNYAAGLRFGGRKTNGTAITQPIQVLYDGPRRFVALLNTTIYDHPVSGPDTSADIPLVRIIFIIDFNKVKKEVTIFKDIKSLIGDKILVGKMNVQFSNRGQVDLGREPSPGYKSFVHFYTEGTCGEDDTMTEGLLTKKDPDEYTIINDPQIRRDGKTCGPHYEYHLPPGPSDVPAVFDVLQVINPHPDVRKVFFAAFWPMLSDWTAYGWNIPGVQSGLVFRSMDAGDRHYIDIPTPPGEPEIPFYIGEWDFELDDAAAPDNQWRSITVYGVTDWGTNQYTGRPETDWFWPPNRIPVGLGEDNDPNFPATPNGARENRIEREVAYLLKQKFKPFDLLDAVHKQTYRWVQFATVPTSGIIDLTAHLSLLDAKPWEVVDNPVVGNATFSEGLQHDVRECSTDATCVSKKLSTDWDTYSAFSERVINLDTGRLLVRGVDYVIDTTLAGRPNDAYIRFITVPPGTRVKILYSTTADYNKAQLATAPGQGQSIPLQYAPVRPNNLIAVINLQTGGLVTDAFQLGDCVTDGQGPQLCWSLEQIDDTVEPGTPIKIIYDSIRGRYEWIVVGRDAATVDSAGAAMVSEAFDSLKNIEVDKAGMDMRALPLPDDDVAYVFRKFRTDQTPDRLNYLFNRPAGDFRTALRDDWSTTVPVASSNIIAVGGPQANLFSEYLNEFSSAIFIPGDISLLLVPHWNHPELLPGRRPDVRGHGVITVYKDLNGTVGLAIWGGTGEDTWALSTAMFQYGFAEIIDSCPFIADNFKSPNNPYGCAEPRTYNRLIEFLQDINIGIVTVVVKIEWTPMPSGDRHPRITVIEKLNTFSEKPIHPDP